MCFYRRISYTCKHNTPCEVPEHDPNRIWWCAQYEVRRSTPPYWQARPCALQHDKQKPGYNIVDLVPEEKCPRCQGIQQRTSQQKIVKEQKRLYQQSLTQSTAPTHAGVAQSVYPQSYGAQISSSQTSQAQTSASQWNCYFPRSAVAGQMTTTPQSNGTVQQSCSPQIYSAQMANSPIGPAQTSTSQWSRYMVKPLTDNNQAPTLPATAPQSNTIGSRAAAQGSVTQQACVQHNGIGPSSVINSGTAVQGSSSHNADFQQNSHVQQDGLKEAVEGQASKSRTSDKSKKSAEKKSDGKKRE